MKIKRSLLCGTICRQDLTRFFPVWSLEFVFLLLSVVFPIVSGLRAYKMEWSARGYFATMTCCMASPVATYSPEGEIRRLIEEFGGVLNHPFVIAPLCLVIALFLFSYLFKARAAYSMHALPFTREQLFFSHYIAGLIMLVVPFGIAYGILAGMAKWYGAVIGREILIQFFITMVEILLFYHLACCSVMITANGIMTAAIYFVVNILFQGLAMMFTAIASFCIYGYQWDETIYTGLVGKYLTPMVFFLGESSLEEVLYYYLAERNEGKWSMDRWTEDWQLWYGPEPEQTLWYLVPALLLFVLAIYLYKKRPLESVGNMMAFPWGKSLFQIVFTICGSTFCSVMFFGTYLNEKGDFATYGETFYVFLFLLIIGSVLCYFISNMILLKSFFIWKKISYGRMVLLTIVIIGIFCYMKYGYGARIPSVQNVASAQIEIQDTGIFEENVYYVTGKKQLEEFQKIHKKILQFGDDCPRVDSLNASCIKITYQLEDKQKITRYYTVRGLDMEEIELKEFLSDTQGILERVFSPAYQEFQYIAARVDDKDGNLICEKIYENIQDEKEIEKMYEAVLLDLQEGNIVLGKYRKHALFYVKMDSLFSEELIKKYNLPEEFFNDDFEEESEKRCSVCLPVTKKCTNINKILEAWGISGDYPEVGSTIFLE